MPAKPDDRPAQLPLLSPDRTRSVSPRRRFGIKTAVNNSRDASPRSGTPRGILKTTPRPAYRRASTVTRLSAPGSPRGNKENLFKTPLPSKRVDKFYTPQTSMNNMKRMGSQPSLISASLPRRSGRPTPSRAKSTTALNHSLDDEGEAHSGSRVQIALRVRPSAVPGGADDDQVDAGNILTVDQSSNIVSVDQLVGENAFAFDHVFHTPDDQCAVIMNPNEGQLRVYEAIGIPILDALLAGRHCALLAYGQTGSGKTHSITGSPSAPGLLHRLCDELFRRVEDEIEMERADIHISYYEIYKEKVYDLLVESSDALVVRENPETGPYIEHLSSMPVTSLNGVLTLLRFGAQRRATASTAMNHRSSRSHAVCLLTVQQTKTVELGGTPQRVQESININKSLMQLNMVIRERAQQCLMSRSGHVNYRDSMLTWLLKDALSGNACTYLLATVWPSEAQRSETISTLRMAGIAKQITQTSMVNGAGNDQAALQSLMKQILQLEAENKRLQSLPKQESSKIILETPQTPTSPSTNSVLRSQMRELQCELERISCTHRSQLAEIARRDGKAEAEVERMRALMCKSGVWLASQAPTGDKFTSPFIVNLKPDPVDNVAHDLQAFGMTSIGSADDASVRVEGLLASHVTLLPIEGGRRAMLRVDKEVIGIDTDSPVYVNGMRVTRSQSFLDRICILGDTFFLVYLPTTEMKLTADDLVSTLARHSFGSARAELLTQQMPAFEARLLRDTKDKLAAEHAAVVAELRAQIDVINVKMNEAKLKIAENEQKSSVEHDAELERLRAENKALLDERLATEMVFEEVCREEKEVGVRKPNGGVGMADTMMLVDRANALLAQKGVPKDNYRFAVDNDQAMLVKVKDDTCVKLSLDRLRTRVECIAECADRSRIFAALHHVEDVWTSVPTDSSMLSTLQSAVENTAKRLSTDTASVRRSLGAASTSSKRRSTFSSYLDSFKSAPSAPTARNLSRISEANTSLTSTTSALDTQYWMNLGSRLAHGIHTANGTVSAESIVQCSDPSTMFESVSLMITAIQSNVTSIEQCDFECRTSLQIRSSFESLNTNVITVGHVLRSSSFNRDQNVETSLTSLQTSVRYLVTLMTQHNDTTLDATEETPLERALKQVRECCVNLMAALNASDTLLCKVEDTNIDFTVRL